MAEEKNQPAATPRAEHKRGQRKERRGVVVAANTAKTVLVVVTRRVRHPKYNKFITRRAKYAVHDLIGCAVGDQVRIAETRPISKTKRWRVVEKLAKGA